MSSNRRFWGYSVCSGVFYLIAVWQECHAFQALDARLRVSDGLLTDFA